MYFFLFFPQKGNELGAISRPIALSYEERLLLVPRWREWRGGGKEEIIGTKKEVGGAIENWW